jgi:glycosyltransferase involved in cell wall biosynthesis
MTISLIIVAHNEEKYIADCLDHVLRNSGGIFTEILVVDNASTDHTSEVAVSFPGVRVVRENKKGITYARQRGYEEAQGDILAYIDADTRMPVGWGSRVHNEFEKNSNLVCLSGPYIYYDTNNFERILVRIYWYCLAMPMYYILGYLVVGGNFAIKRSTLDAMSGFDTSIDFYGEDTNIGRRAKVFGRVLFKPNFIIETSPRRIRDHGFFRLAGIYILNFLSEAFFHKPVHTDSVDVR